MSELLLETQKLGNSEILLLIKKTLLRRRFSISQEEDSLELLNFKFDFDFLQADRLLQSSKNLHFFGKDTVFRGCLMDSSY